MKRQINLLKYRRTWYVLVFLILPAFGNAWGAKTCYDCHKKQKDEYSQFKYQHQPTKEENCESCHKRHGFAQQLILQDNTSELCYTCHADLKEKYAQGSVHYPVSDGRCWDCHNPHGSDTKGVLWTLPAELESDNFCALCHKDIIDSALAMAVPHQPFQQQKCANCHTSHNSMFDGLLTGEVTTLCGGCHEPADQKMLKAHENRHTEGLPCSDCHAPHASNTKGLMSSRTHAPFAEGECETCHSLPDAEGKVSFEDGVSPGQICGNCHDDIVSSTKKSHPHAAVEAENCTDCHLGHSSRFGNLLVKDERTLCGECHSDVLSGSGKKPHVPVLLGQCSSCHEVHGSDKPALVKSSGAELCLTCHKDFEKRRDESAHVHAAADNCLDCHGPHEGVEAGILRKPPDALCADCHQIDKASINAGSGHQPYLTGNCVGCHVPHFSQAAHLVRDDGNKACLTCHVDVASRVEMAVPHPPAVDDCKTCHKPHYSENPDLMVSPEKDICASCHDYKDLDMEQEFVHAPAKEGDCSGCHNPHGGMDEKLVTGRLTKLNVNGRVVGQLPKLTGKASDLCYLCHEDLQEKFRQQGTHAPVAAGDCDVCHAAHGSSQEGFVTAAAPELCVGCHAVDDQLAAAHDGYNLSSADCLSCHNPHVSGQPKLVRSQLHPPFAENSCEDCHEKDADGKAVVSGDIAELCGACHDSISDEMAKKYPHGPFTAGECGRCHGVHAADNAKLLKHEGGMLCFSCHEDVREESHLAVNHRPFAEEKCLDCHEPHASAYAGLINTPPESFCLSCHEELKQALDKGTPHKPVVSGECTSCHKPHSGALPALLTESKRDLCGNCHELASASMTAAHKGFALTDVDCQNCHEAHVGPKGLLLPNSHPPFAEGDCSSCHEGQQPHQLNAPVKELCFACHDDFLASASPQAVIHPPLQEQDGCVGCHGPHVGYGKALQMKKGPKTCLTCHESAEFTGTFKHQAAFEDCQTCHEPHLSTNKSLLQEADVMELCLGCHDKAKETHYHPMGDDTISPLTKEPLNCVGCHSPHSSNYASILVADKDRKLCVICHSVAH